MAPRGQRQGRPPRQRVNETNETPFSPTRPVEPASSFAPPGVGDSVLYRINVQGDIRPATVVRVDDPIDCRATVFVLTLPGDEIAAAARVQMRVAVRSKRGDGIGEWQPRN
jgi:hypothetical protein